MGVGLARPFRYKEKNSLGGVYNLAERVGFEPTVARKGHNGFRDRPDRPLRHLSAVRGDYSAPWFRFPLARPTQGSVPAGNRDQPTFHGGLALVSLRRGRFGPLLVGARGFTLRVRHEGQLKLEILPLSVHELRVLLATLIRSGL